MCEAIYVYSLKVFIIDTFIHNIPFTQHHDNKLLNISMLLFYGDVNSLVSSFKHRYLSYR